MTPSEKQALLDFERALAALANALRECERLLSTTALPEALVHDETFQRLLALLRVENQDCSGDTPAGPGPGAHLLH